MVTIPMILMVILMLSAFVAGIAFAIITELD